MKTEINGFKIVTQFTEKMKGHWLCVAVCKVCSNKWETQRSTLETKQSCGCVRKGVIASRYSKTHPQLSRTIQNMKARCYNKKHPSYKNYGGRGIGICVQWHEDRNVFCAWALENGFEEGKNLSIERLDNSQGYSPENCCWIIKPLQARNTRQTTLTGEVAVEIRKSKGYMTASELSQKHGVPYQMVYRVLNNLTWTNI